MRRLLPLLLVAAWASSARAGGDVGVVVTGDSTMQPQVLSLLEGWLRAHGHQLVSSPLPPEATNKLIDCFVIEDTSCARKIVEGQAKTATVVFTRVEVTDNTATGMRDVTLTAYWFDRGSEPVAEKRACDKCTDATLRTTGDELMSALAGSNKKIVGQLKVGSDPPGAHVTIDGASAGTTPLEIALAPGPHVVAIALDGEPESSRTVTITKGSTAVVNVRLRHAGGSGVAKPKLPLALMGVGGALLLTGIVLYATSETDTGEKFEYRETRPLGVGLSIGGLVVASIGTYLWFTRGKPADSSPTVALVPSGAVLGWGKSF